jgi:glutamyl-tRNA reductase
MHLLAFGLNHNSASIDVRERAAFTAERLENAILNLTARKDVSEATILSTCNRTEIYCRQQSAGSDSIHSWISEYSGLSPKEINDSVYLFPNDQAVKHAFRVASGLDSMVLGEPQILGQMKDAFAVAHRAGATGKILNRMFQHTFSVAKQVRTDTSVGTNAVSVAYAAVDLAKRLFNDLSSKVVLLIGAGETIELVARHLLQNGVKQIIVANRSIERAENLAREIRSEAISLGEIPARLYEADIVVASTASTLPILGKGAVESAIKKRKHRPMFMVDLAVPRDIESEVSSLRDVYLYTVDDLADVIDQNMNARKEAAIEAEKIIDLQVVRFMRWLNSLNSVPTVRSFRREIEEIRKRELDRAIKRLQSGTNPEDVLERLSRNLTGKFSHLPSKALRKADESGNAQLIGAMRTLFNLENE